MCGPNQGTSHVLHLLEGVWGIDASGRGVGCGQQLGGLGSGGLMLWGGRGVGTGQQLWGAGGLEGGLGD